MKKSKAFTLVELLVVIAIIAILAVAGVVGYTVFIDKAHKSNAVRDLTDIKTLIIAEDSTNSFFEITSTGITFDGLYFVGSAIETSGEDTEKVGAGENVTDAIYNLAFNYVITNSSNDELKALAAKLTYASGVVTYNSGDATAAWDIAQNTIE